jgi:hypothetical protein
MVYTEDAIVEKPPGKHFADVDRDMLNCREEAFGVPSPQPSEGEGVFQTEKTVVMWC